MIFTVWFVVLAALVYLLFLPAPHTAGWHALFAVLAAAWFLKGVVSGLYRLVAGPRAPQSLRPISVTKGGEHGGKEATQSKAGGQ